MQKYDRPTRELMHDFAKATLHPGQVFHPQLAIDWFAKDYGLIKPVTVRMHVEGMSVNSPRREHHAGIKPGSGHDLFFKLGPGQYRLWDPAKDPQPMYRPELMQARKGGAVAAGAAAAAAVVSPTDDDADDAEPGGQSRRFAYEADLKNYLARNLSALEKGLALYEDEGLTGIEFDVGGRRIDILAVGSDGALVVVELKVERGYDRVLGQIARYMGYIKKNLAEGKPVRGIIVASDITEDLRIAASMIPDVRLVEYEISFRLKPVGA
jgi:endonuclease